MRFIGHAVATAFARAPSRATHALIAGARSGSSRAQSSGFLPAKFATGATRASKPARTVQQPVTASPARTDSTARCVDGGPSAIVDLHASSRTVATSVSRGRCVESPRQTTTGGVRNESACSEPRNTTSRLPLRGQRRVRRRGPGGVQAPAGLVAAAVERLHDDRLLRAHESRDRDQRGGQRGPADPTQCCAATITFGR